MKIPEDFENKESREYRYPRFSGLPMRSISFRPAPEVPRSPGWQWVVCGLLLGAVLLALITFAP